MSSWVFDVCWFSHGLLILGTFVWCNMTVQNSLSLPFLPSLSIPWDLWSNIAHLSPLWPESVSDWRRPLALLQWPVKYSSINHLWLLKEPDSWPPETVGLHLRGEGGVWIRRGGGVLSCPTVKPCFISPAALWAWLDHQATWFLSFFFFYPFSLQNFHQGREVWCRVETEECAGWRTVKPVIWKSKGLKCVLVQPNEATATFKPGRPPRPGNSSHMP